MTLIDNIITNREIYCTLHCGILLSDLSDHFPCVMSWSNIQKNKRQSIEFTSKKLDEKNLPSVKEALTINWNFLHACNNVDESFQLFHQKLLDITAKFTEEKTIKFPSKN